MDIKINKNKMYLLIVCVNVMHSLKNSKIYAKQKKEDEKQQVKFLKFSSGVIFRPKIGYKNNTKNSRQTKRAAAQILFPIWLDKKIFGSLNAAYTNYKNDFTVASDKEDHKQTETEYEIDTANIKDLSTIHKEDYSLSVFYLIEKEYLLAYTIAINYHYTKEAQKYREKSFGYSNIFIFGMLFQKNYIGLGGMVGKDSSGKLTYGIFPAIKWHLSNDIYIQNPIEENVYIKRSGLELAYIPENRSYEIGLGGAFYGGQLLGSKDQYAKLNGNFLFTRVKYKLFKDTIHMSFIGGVNLKNKIEYKKIKYESASDFSVGINIKLEF